MRQVIRGLLTAMMVFLSCGLNHRRAAAAQVPAHPAQTLLYRWKLPASGSRQEWTFGKGVASYGGQFSRTLIAPFHVPAGTNFAVQASIRMLGFGGADVTYSDYGLVARPSASDAHDSLQGGSFFSDYESDIVGPELLWQGDTIGQGDFTPNHAWHVYRLEVQGTQVTLRIDGVPMVQYRIDGVSGLRRVGVYSDFYRVQVKDVRVYALPAAGPAPAPLPPTKQVNLTLADMPADTYSQRLLRHYYTNEQTARLRSTDVSTLNGAGRLASYGVDYFVDRWSGKLYCAVSAYTTASGALADEQSRYDVLKARYASAKGFAELPVNQVGDRSFGITAEDTSDGYSTVIVLLWFVRGNYGVYLTADVLAGQVPLDQVEAQLLREAHIVDDRIRALPAGS